jgi:deoxyribose-phosphate aldolase
MLTKLEFAQMVDISTVRSYHTLSDIVYIVELAKKYRFINVHVLPCWVKQTAEMLKDIEGVLVGSPVGFPGGGHRSDVKIAEAKGLIADGVGEMDVVLNIGKFKNKEYAYCLDELKAIVALSGNILTKVIIEINALTDDEMKKACEIVMESGADFIKTGTGWVTGDANIKRIQKIKQWTSGKIKVKAAGGIRTREEFLALYELGVERFGINANSALEILHTFE